MSTVKSDLTMVPHIVWGEVEEGSAIEYPSSDGGGWATPRLDLDALALPRSVPGPAFDLPLAEILDFLEETGRRLASPSNPLVEEAVEMLSPRANVSRAVLAMVFRDATGWFDRSALEYSIERDVGYSELDGWTPLLRTGQPAGSVRAFPARLIHVMAGNSPSTAAISITRGALSKGLNLLKMASNDLFSATVILRIMREIDPTHPTLRSFSAVYWRGGDTSVEDLLFRPQYFDKLVVWGGEAAIRHAVQYAGPGFEIVQYDPKMSISLIGRSVFDDHDDDVLASVATRAADDSTSMNQDTCASSRYHFVEGTIEEVDSYCELLVEQLGMERPFSDAVGPRTPTDIRMATEVMRGLDPLYRVWGDYEGNGLVVRSEEPVEFHPMAKTVNVVRVPKIEDALTHVTVATQTVGIYPSSLKAVFRDRLATAGVQRVVSLGLARSVLVGLPHDGHMPLQRLVHWVSDEGD
jgi:hypothetical protein